MLILSRQSIAGLSFATAAASRLRIAAAASSHQWYQDPLIPGRGPGVAVSTTVGRVATVGTAGAAQPQVVHGRPRNLLALPNQVTHNLDHPGKIRPSPSPL